MKNFLAQGGINASEEALTEVANIAFDYYNLGDKSDFSRAVAAHRADGLDEEAARKAAYRDMGARVTEAAPGGALMGEAFALIGSAASARETRLNSRFADEGRQQALLCAAEQSRDAQVRSLAGQMKSTEADVGDYTALYQYRQKNGQVLSELVLDRLAEGGMDVEAALSDRRESYRRQGVELNEAEARSELVCESLPAILSDERALKSLVETNRGLAERIRDFLREFVEQMGRLIRSFGREEAQALMEDVETLRNIADGLDYALEGAKAGEYSTGIPLESMEKYSLPERDAIEGYLAGVDPDILEAAQTYRSDKNAKFGRFPLGEVQAREAADIKALLGEDISGYTHTIDKNALVHIEERHGIKGQADSSMADLNDVARAGWILKNYDSIEILRSEKGEAVYSSGYLSQGRPAPMLRYKKKINGTYYLVEAIAVGKWKRLWVVSAYINKKGAAQSPDAKGPMNNVRNANAPTPESIVADGGENVKHFF